MRSTGRRAILSTITVLAVGVGASCAADRAAPVATPPPPPTTAVATTVATTPPTTIPPASASTTSTTVAPASTTTTTMPPPIQLGTLDAWAVFDWVLATRLLGAGDFAASVAVAVDGSIVHTAAYGVRVPPGDPFAPDPEPRRSTRARRRAEPVERTDRFRIASISKMITATVVLQLVEAGELRLDQPVGGLLADVVDTAVGDPVIAGITLRQLLSHTSGFPVYQGTFFGGGARSCREAAQQGLAGSLLGPPGGVYQYSNLNFCLLGLLISHVTGMSYERAVRTMLLEPLGISGMRLVGTFDPDDDEVVHPSLPRRNYMEVLEGAGSWVASATDVVTIVDSLDSAKPGWHPLSERLLRQMRLPMAGITYPNGAERWYGLGTIVFGDGSWGHTGTVENTHAMVLDRPDGMTWAVLVSGEYPFDTTELRVFVDESMATAGIAVS